ncbi:MAG: hypothetical protein AAF149_18250 [Bacteroidota bacterium]
MRLLWLTILLPTLMQAQQIQFATNPTQMASHHMILEYQLPENLKEKTLKLTLLHNYGLLQLNAAAKECAVAFELPQSISSNAGAITLRLNGQSGLLAENKFTIIPDTIKLPLMEAYSGPKQILTGGKDYTAVVGTTLDSMDNPWPEKTPVDFNYTYKGKQKRELVASKSLYAYQRFFSDNQSGNATITVFSQEAPHQEFDLTLYPNFPESFDLFEERDHDFADGKQVAEVYTSPIKDRYNNFISDGTLVHFTVYENNRIITQANGEIIRGVASINLPAPIKPITWKVEARINNFSVSTPVLVTFKKSIQGYKAKMIGNHQLQAGPIKGFNKQLVADHTPVEIQIMQNGFLQQNVIAFTKGGMAHLDLERLDLEPCEYTLILNCGDQKTILTAVIR